MPGIASITRDFTAAPDTVRTGRALPLAFISIVLLVVAGTVLALWDGRRTAVRAYEDRQARLANVLAEQAGRVIQAADLAVSSGCPAEIQARRSRPTRIFVSCWTSETGRTELREKHA